MAEDAVAQSLRDPIPEATKARLVYLVQTVQGPAYKEVRKQPEFLRNTSPNERRAWELKHNLDSWAYESKRVPIEGSSLRRQFMADLFKEAQENVKQHTDSAEAEVERNAQELFGGVAESQEEWQHQKDLGNRARSRERSYEEASKSLTEAIATTFSEALGTLVPEAGELTKEWMKDLLDEAIIPSLEHRIEGQALSVLKWSEQNFTVGHIQDIPDTLEQEIKSAPLIVDHFLFPLFLRKQPATDASPFGNGRVPPDVAQEILSRTKTAEEELGGGLQPIEESVNRDAHRGSPLDRPRAGEELERMKKEQELRERWQERIREGKVRRGPEVP